MVQEEHSFRPLWFKRASYMEVFILHLPAFSSKMRIRLAQPSLTTDSTCIQSML